MSKSSLKFVRISKSKKSYEIHRSSHSDFHPTIDPDITAKLNSAAPIISAESYETQRYYYENWNVAAGRPCKDDYTQYVTLGNQAAVLNNFKDMGDMWRAPYEDDKFQDTVEKLWKDVKPLYEKIHGYVQVKFTW